MKHTIIHQKDEPLYPEVLFNRPINPLLKPVILLIGGGAGKLTTLSSSYQIIGVLGIRRGLVAPKNLASLGDLLPITAYIEPTRAGQINKAALAAVANDSNLMVLAPDLANNSTNQLACDYLLRSYQSAVVITDEILRLAAISPDVLVRSNVIYFISTAGLIALANYLKIGIAIRPNRGIYNKIDIIKSLQNKLTSDFVVYDQQQILICTLDGQIGVTDIKSTDIFDQQGILLGLLASLVADYSGQLKNVFKRTMMAGYIFKSAASKQLKNGSIIDAVKAVIESQN